MACTLRRSKADRRRWQTPLSLVSLLIPCLTLTACARASSSNLASQLSDEAFWQLSTSLSEPAGTFSHSDNLVSNELQFIHTVRSLYAMGGVYIGVGPEQNFSYIARLQPAMAFIIDIRRENRDLHLLYKALFELSADRADFVSRLFSRGWPPDARRSASVQELFRVLAAAVPSSRLYEDTLRTIGQRLMGTHRFPLTSEDMQWVEHSLAAFRERGPEMNYYYDRPPPIDQKPAPSYRYLMSLTDVGGESRSYLATDEAFAFVKDLQTRNLIVPVIGDFGSPTVIRRAGAYIQERGALVSAFYASNVEVYLSKQQTATFCGSLAALPRHARAWFIDGRGLLPLRTKLDRCAAPAH